MRRGIAWWLCGVAAVSLAAPVRAEEPPPAPAAAVEAPVPAVSEPEPLPEPEPVPEPVPAPAPAPVPELAPAPVAATPADGRKPLDPDRLEWALLPILAGNTDMGILVGGQIILAKFADGYRPYRFRTHTQVAISFKDGPDGIEFPVHMDFAKFDLPGLMGGKLRLYVELAFNQTGNAGWFGLGNASRTWKPSTDPAEADIRTSDPRRYQYRRTEPMLRVHLRTKLREHWSLMSGVRFVYMMTGIRNGSALDRDRDAGRLLGTRDHPALQFSLGVQWDTRDNETAPSRGFLCEASLRFSPTLGTGLTFGGASLDGRAFVPLAGEYLVLATRLVTDLLFGDVPFYEMTRAGAFLHLDFPGGRQGLPGIPDGRLAGRIKVGGNVELRSTFWDFTVMDVPMRLGALVFADAGRVWAGYRRNDELDGTGAGIQYGIGAGLRLQWGSTLMVRADVAWSPSSRDAGSPIGIYLDAEHLF